MIRWIKWIIWELVNRTITVFGFIYKIFWLHSAISWVYRFPYNITSTKFVKKLQKINELNTFTTIYWYYSRHVLCELVISRFVELTIILEFSNLCVALLREDNAYFVWWRWLRTALVVGKIYHRECAKTTGLRRSTELT